LLISYDNPLIEKKPYLVALPHCFFQHLRLTAEDILFSIAYSSVSVDDIPTLNLTILIQLDMVKDTIAEAELIKKVERAGNSKAPTSERKPLLQEEPKEGGGKNKSALHWDMIKDMKNGELYIDGKLIQKWGVRII